MITDLFEWLLYDYVCCVRFVTDCIDKKSVTRKGDALSRW